MSQTRIEQLRHQNSQLKQRIAQIQAQQHTSSLHGEIAKFVEESKINLTDMNRKIVQENSRQNTLLHSMTANYENVLKKQIDLLNENKKLSEQKEGQDRNFNEGVQKLTAEYQNQIKQFEIKVKSNVKRIQDLSNGGNMIARLIANPRFRQVMQERGCSLDALENQCKLQEVSQQVEERQKEIHEAQEKSARLDEELSKMHQLIDTMKNLLENMMKEKDNILKQNVVLKEKLKQSEVLIAKLLGQGLQEQVGEEDEEEEEEQVNEEEEKQPEGQEQAEAEDNNVQSK